MTVNKSKLVEIARKLRKSQAYIDDMFDNAVLNKDGVARRFGAYAEMIEDLIQNDGARSVTRSRTESATMTTTT